MKNKVLAAVGVLLILASVAAWYIFTITIRENSELLGKEVLIIMKDVKEGEPLTTANVTVKRVKQEDVVPYAISASEGYKLNGKVAAIDMYQNEQITESRLTIPEYMATSSVRLVSLPISRPISVLPGNVNANDYIDIWNRAGGEPVLVMKNARIVSLRDANNADISTNPTAVPAALIVQANYLSEIVLLRSINEADMFITKSPNQTGIRLEQNQTPITETPAEDPETPGSTDETVNSPETPASNNIEELPNPETPSNNN